MHGAFYGLLGLPAGFRVSIILGLLMIFYWFFGQVACRILSVIPLILRKLVYCIFFMIEIPISLLHKIAGGVFSSIDQGLSSATRKMYMGLERCFNSLYRPRTTHRNKALIIFIILCAYFVVPALAGVESNVFTFWEDNYLRYENRVVEFIESRHWFVAATPDERIYVAYVPTNIQVEETPQYQVVPEIELPYSFYELRFGDGGELVVEIQLRMQELGFYSGPISGDFGPLTETAVINFQEAMGLEPNGVVDVYAWRLLFIE